MTTGALERLSRRWWAGELGWRGRALDVLLAPVSWLWSGVTALRNARYDRTGGTAVEGLTVVSVGNLAVGGSGKTPFASWVARACAASGSRPAVLLSGYGRDEKLLHERWTPEAPVLARPDRLDAARGARAAGADVAILDDGFQHRRVRRDLDIVLVPVERPLAGRILPRGPHREGPRALARAGAVVLTRRTGTLEQARAVAADVDALRAGLVRGCVRLSGGRWTDLAGEARPRPEGDVLAVAGVARPETFRGAVASLTDGRVELLAFGDHHEYGSADVERVVRRARGRPVVVTEKDAVKLVSLGGPARDWLVLEQAVEWDWGEDEVLALLAAHLAPVSP